MKHKVTAERLAEALIIRGIRAAELSQLSGVSQSSISQYLKGSHSPSGKSSTMMAKVLGVDPLWLSGFEGVPMQGFNNVIPYVPSNDTQIPVYGCIPAGLPLEAIDCIDGYVDVPSEWLAKGDEYFGLRVKGDSMSPKYLDGDLIILRRQPDCESGQDAAVRVNGDEATLKKVVKLMDGIMLQPLNPEYTPRQYDYTDEFNPVEIMGVVVQLRRDV